MFNMVTMVRHYLRYSMFGVIVKLDHNMSPCMSISIMQSMLVEAARGHKIEIQPTQNLQPQFATSNEVRSDFIHSPVSGKGMLSN